LKPRFKMPSPIPKHDKIVVSRNVYDWLIANDSKNNLEVTDNRYIKRKSGVIVDGSEGFPAGMAHLYLGDYFAGVVSVIWEDGK
jgi:hypothetical protein